MRISRHRHCVHYRASDHDICIHVKSQAKEFHTHTHIKYIFENILPEMQLISQRLVQATYINVVRLKMAAKIIIEKKPTTNNSP